MLKYKLSKHITITDIEDEEVVHKHAQPHYILYDGRRDKEFLINATIKYFVDKFSSPKSEDEILQEVMNDIQGSVEQVKETCSSFFNFLCFRKILVPENEDEIVILREALYKEGDCIADLTIVEVLSNKRFVDVYSAVDSNGNEIVIKLLNRNKTAAEHIYERELAEMEREYRRLKDVNHIPMMCKAFTLDKSHNQYAYIVLEYIQGKSLFDFFDETEGLTKTDCLLIIEQILEAFSLLHASGLIHGDIHSSNVLVREDKSVKIIDLGLSRHVEPEKNEVLHFGGVNFYMPPERINTTSVHKYAKEPDLYSDVYQLGLLMYLVLYNDLPFDGFTWEELAVDIKERTIDYPDASFLNFPVSAQLVEIIKKCLDKNPLERYKDAGEILSDFKKHAFAEQELTVI